MTDQTHTRKNTTLLLSACLLGACVQIDSPPVTSLQAAVFTNENYKGTRFRVFVPTGYSAAKPAPLVVVLHGCTQDADQIAAGTQMNQLAESQGFLVLYPEQSTAASALRCWQWWVPSSQVRDSGEPKLITELVAQVQAKYSIDAERIHVTGLSAGAAMSVILGAAYPDLFASIGVGSGLEYKAASSQLDATSAMRTGGPSPASQGRAAYSAMGARRRTVPVMVFHGSGDTTVYPVNAEQLVAQWAKTLDLASDGKEDGNIDDVADQQQTATSPGGRRYTRYSYQDKSSAAVVIEKIMVEGMAHAWSGGGSGSYTDTRGPDESALMWEFFKRHPKSGPVTPPDMGRADAGATDLGRPDAGALDLGGRIDFGTPPDLGGSIDFGAARDLASAFDLATSTDGGIAVDAGVSDLASTVDLSVPPASLSVASTAAEDGYVGALRADGISAATLKVGDKGMFNQDTYRGVLSFDLGTLPSGVAVKSAQLILTRKSQQGNVSHVFVDVKQGALGSSRSLAADDYSAPVTVTSAAAFAPPSADGKSVVIPLPLATLGPLGSRSLLQLRLRAQTTTDFPADVLEFFDGSAGPLAPTLQLTY